MGITCAIVTKIIVVNYSILRLLFYIEFWKLEFAAFQEMLTLGSEDYLCGPRNLQCIQLLSNIAICVQGDLIASADAGGGIHIWDIATRSEVYAVSFAPTEVTSLTFDPSGTLTNTCTPMRRRCI